MAVAVVAIGTLLSDPAQPAAPLTKGVYGGVIKVGRGAAGVRLGMTREQVIAILGRPFAENANGYMQYARTPHGNVPDNAQHGLFDVYLRNGRVRMMIIGTHPGFRLGDGTPVFAAGTVGHLMHRFGRRLRAVREEDGEPVYRVSERYLGRTVWTDFWPERFARDTRLMDVAILFPPG